MEGTAHCATEQLTLEQALAILPQVRGEVGVLCRRLRGLLPLPAGARVLDVGAANGLQVAAWQELGFRASGVEPWEAARANAQALAGRLGVTLDIAAGTAESLPFPDGTFDLVAAKSVVEHVEDVDRAFAEAYRVLKPGGVFWFYTASAMCPVQSEIRGFPLFGWYPDGCRRRIMEWAKVHRPALVGGTTRPAVHWFTPWKARRLLRRQGFGRVCDRWDLRRPEEHGRAGQLVLRLIRTGAVTRFAANVLAPGCGYAAVKEGGRRRPET
jgi:SAM-dependent methyltransferase